MTPHERFRSLVLQSTGIVHAGAHKGQERRLYTGAGKPVLWIEAYPPTCEVLRATIAEHDDQRAVCALLHDGTRKTARFHISNNEDGLSSSLYPFGPYSSGERSLWPDRDLKMVDKVELPCRRLDDVLQEDGEATGYDLLVLDVQGAELDVLRGAGAALDRFRFISTEVSTVEVYEGGARWSELETFLRTRGFTPMWQPRREHGDVAFVRSDRASRAEETFGREESHRLNTQRLEHLDSLGLDLSGKRVLEVGAGVGDLTPFFIDQGCQVTTTDVRPENVDALRQRFAGHPLVDVGRFDAQGGDPPGEGFEVVFFYGVLHHLSDPEKALSCLARSCTGLLLLESCVTVGPAAQLHPHLEGGIDRSQGLDGVGCRPTRQWVWEALEARMPHVYSSRTRPRHECYPQGWSQRPARFPGQEHLRAVFLASQKPLSTRGPLVRCAPSRQA
jgi:FkbM family methyltransferase